MNKNIACCFTGHRFIPYDEYNIVCKNLEKTIVSLIEKHGVKYFCAGGALGFDTLAAKTVLKLKEKYENIFLILFLPCVNQYSLWKENDIKVYKNIMAQCDKYYYISKEYTKSCMFERNKKMVDNCNYCISYLKKSFGGTAFTVNYAKSKNLSIINL